jgi:hypothetical protein
MPDSISFEKAQQKRRRGKWQHIHLKPKGSTLKSDPSARRDLQMLIVAKTALPILYPKGGLERKAVAHKVKELRKLASQFPMQK